MSNEMLFLMILSTILSLFIALDMVNKINVKKEIKKNKEFKKMKHGFIIDLDRKERTEIIEDDEAKKKSEEHIKSKQEISVEEIISQIFKIYYENKQNNKKEIIINLLRYLYTLDDTGDFLEKNADIRNFIFN